MRLVLATLSVTAILSVFQFAHAAEPPMRGSAPMFWGPKHGRPRLGAHNKQAAIAAYGRAVYPKYYWGFHARELQNIGVPHGDVGMLGSGLTRDPW
jgi:hypothetical protein